VNSIIARKKGKIEDMGGGVIKLQLEREYRKDLIERIPGVNTNKELEDNKRLERNI